MAGMGRGFGITAAVGHDVVRELASEVEGLGYTSFWVNDMPGADGLASLGVALAVTSDIDLGVGVIPLDRRPAPAIAARVNELGLPLHRVVLGVGSGNAKHSLALVRESVGALKVELPARVVVGALGPKMSVVAGEVADGVLFNWMTPEHIAKIGRSVRGSLMAYVRCALLPQSQARLTEEADRYSAISSYRDHLARMGATALDTCVAGPDAAALQPGIAQFEAVLDETVVRAITPDDTLGSLRALARACAP
jgi:alkanesulfonate monooxygenase SsuD/methylene tetrahydromethanopterin reductase-like flavin-dependent oxidoreductase (luciferase family)